MGTVQERTRLENVRRGIAIAGGAIAAWWGIGWIIRTGDLFGDEGRLQVMISIAVTIWFALLSANRQLPRWFWVNNAFLSLLWAWRCNHKHDPLGLATFLTSAGLALAGFLIASRLRAVQPRGAADAPAPQ
jgi:hypothetical protein